MLNNSATNQADRLVYLRNNISILTSIQTVSTIKADRRDHLFSLGVFRY